MADFASIEKSIQNATPVELYTFETSQGTFTLTSFDEDVTFGGILYAAVEGGLSRGNIFKSPIGKAREVTIMMPLAHPVAQVFLTYGIEQGTKVTIVRAYLVIGSSQQKWKGDVLGAASEEAHLQLKTQSSADLALAARIPSGIASRTCQHTLYDPVTCRASRSNGNHVHTTTVVNIAGNTVTLASIGARPDHWARYGELAVAGPTRRRDVSDQVGTLVTLDRPIVGLQIGDPVQLYKGCDRKPETCRDQFFDPDTALLSNIANFGGHPDLPTVNPLSPTGYGTIIQS